MFNEGFVTFCHAGRLIDNHYAGSQFGGADGNHYPADRGLTQNHTFVLATYILVFVNLMLIAKDLIRSWFDAEKLASAE